MSHLLIYLKSMSNARLRWLMFINGTVYENPKHNN